MKVASIICAVIMLLVVSGPVDAQESNNTNYILLSASEQSTLKIEGTSTLHSWDVVAGEFNVNFSVPEMWLQSTENWDGSDVDKLEVVVPIEEMDGGRSRMNRDLKEALRSEEYPEIKFTWSELEFENSGENNGKTAHVKGSLSVAGVTRDIEFRAEMNLVDQSRLQSSGSVEINMKDYDIDPPRALLGTIRTGEMIEIIFELELKRNH